MYVLYQHSFFCRPSDSTVSEDAGIEPRTVATLALAVRRSSHSATSHPLYHYIVWPVCGHQQTEGEEGRDVVVLMGVQESFLCLYQSTCEYT
jgi:hypothetical protein